MNIKYRFACKTYNARYDKTVCRLTAHAAAAEIPRRYYYYYWHPNLAYYYYYYFLLTRCVAHAILRRTRIKYDAVEIEKFLSGRRVFPGARFSNTGRGLVGRVDRRPYCRSRERRRVNRCDIASSLPTGRLRAPRKWERIRFPDRFLFRPNAGRHVRARARAAPYDERPRAFRRFCATLRNGGEENEFPLKRSVVDRPLAVRVPSLNVEECHVW